MFAIKITRRLESVWWFANWDEVENDMVPIESEKCGLFYFNREDAEKDEKRLIQWREDCYLYAAEHGYPKNPNYAYKIEIVEIKADFGKFAP